MCRTIGAVRCGVQKLPRKISYFSAEVNLNTCIMSSSLSQETNKDNAPRITGDIL